MKKITNYIALSLVLVAVLLLVGAALAAPDQTVDWHVIGGGGRHQQSLDGVYTLDGTIGQPVAAIFNADLCAGFWCGMSEWEAAIRNYLPILLGQ